MKKIILLITVLTNIAYSWEVNTHRAIDKTAIEKASNLTNFAIDSNIKGQGSKVKGQVIMITKNSQSLCTRVFSVYDC